MFVQLITVDWVVIKHERFGFFSAHYSNAQDKTYYSVWGDLFMNSNYVHYNHLLIFKKQQQQQQQHKNKQLC